MTSWRLSTHPDYVTVEELLARASQTMDALRIARVNDWCRERVTWTWVEVPRCWLESFTYDLWTLQALGEFQVELAAHTLDNGTGTLKYRLRNVDVQLSFSDVLADNEDHSRIV